MGCCIDCRYYYNCVCNLFAPDSVEYVEEPENNSCEGFEEK